MEAACHIRMLKTVYQTTRHHIPKYSILQAYTDMPGTMKLGNDWHTKAVQIVCAFKLIQVTPCVLHVLPVSYLSTLTSERRYILLWSHIQHYCLHYTPFPAKKKKKEYKIRLRSGDKDRFCCEENKVLFPGMICERDLNIFMASWGNPTELARIPCQIFDY
jgi:hypothetical protein